MSPRSPRRLAWRRILLAISLLALLACEAPQPQASLFPVRISSAAEVEERRRELVVLIWDHAGFPADRRPNRVEPRAASPIEGLPNLARVEDLHLAMADGVEGLAHHFVPRRANGRAVVVAQGHACHFQRPGLPEVDPKGLVQTIGALLAAGYGVLAVYMPHFQPEDCRTVAHGELLDRHPGGHGLRPFFEPVAAGLAHLRSLRGVGGAPAYTDFAMVGLSGGGWTTTVYAALDPSIRVSVAVAGSLPRSMRRGESLGDAEQRWEPLYSRAEYEDLYVLGAAGAGRRQVQVLNRHDPWCFGERPDLFEPLGGLSWERLVRAYEAEAQAALVRIGSGSFRVEIDETATQHGISPFTLERTLLPALAAGDG